MTQVRIDDLRAAGVCPRAKGWFDEMGLSWRTFVTEGYDAEVLRATNHSLPVVERVIAAAERREGKNGQ